MAASNNTKLTCAVRKWAVALALMFLAGGVVAQETAYPEQAVKAAFLLNFPKYVDWPAASFASSNSPVVIAVVGESPVTGELQKMIADRSVGGRSIILKQLASDDVPDDCHILFVPATEQAREPALLARLKDKNILTVGENDHFLDHGGDIQLALQNQKIALQINLPAANAAGLKISSKLLKVADVVKGKAN